jgi:hypothetical protein
VDHKDDDLAANGQGTVLATSVSSKESSTLTAAEKAPRCVAPRYSVH